MKHDLIKTGDPDVYQAILDRNGQVCLNYCRRCRKGEGELEPACSGDASLKLAIAIFTSGGSLKLNDSITPEGVDDLAHTVIRQAEELAALRNTPPSVSAPTAPLARMSRESLGGERKGFNRKFALPFKREDGVPQEIKDGLSYMRDLAVYKLQRDKLDPVLARALTSAVSWIDNIIAPTPSVELMKIYFNVGTYGDGRPGEVFIRADRSGSLASGALDAVAILLSIGLQHGIELHTMLNKLRYTHFEPFGYTKDPEFPSTSSPLDLLAQWLTKKFPPKEP